MKLAALTAGLVAWLGAALASLCCLLPLTVIVLGLGSGAFMATTMQYRWLLVPAGIIGIVAGFILYLRERRRCDAPACRMAGSRVTLALLILASLVVTSAIVLDRFPEFTSDLLARVMSDDQSHTGHNRGQEGPGRAEGRESGGCEPQSEGSGRDVRPSHRDGPADDRDR